MEDLEQQALGASHQVRDDEVDQLGAAAHAQVGLTARLHGELASGRRGELAALIVGGLRLRGQLVRVGVDFFMLDGEAGQWAVMTSAVATLTGLGHHAVLPEARPLTSRLSLRSVLARLGEERLECALVLRDATRLRGVPLRSGADFHEFLVPADRSGSEAFVVAAGALAAVRL